MKTSLHWFLLLVLAAINLGAALGKALDIPGFVGVLEDYRLFPGWSLWTLAVGAVIVEAAVGVWLLSGVRQVEAALACAAINAGYAAVLTVELIRGIPLESCGCFGVFLSRPLRWYSPLEDLALVGASLALAATARARRSGTARPVAPVAPAAFRSTRTA